MWSSLKTLLAANVFPTICYLIAAFFLYAFFLRVGIPPVKDLDATAGTYLALALFMFMLPEAKRLKLGQLFEYEAKVKEIKDDVKQFKEETRYGRRCKPGLSQVTIVSVQAYSACLHGRG